MPPPGAPTEERLIARFHRNARHLFWSALVLIVVSGATAYFYDNLPAPFTNGMLLAAAGLIVLIAVVVPFLIWLSHSYSVTTRRIIAHNGIGARRSQEMSHARGYTITVRLGLFQRMWGAGTVTLTNGVDAPLRLVDISTVSLVHETLADQIEVGQILAHRNAQSATTTPGF